MNPWLDDRLAANGQPVRDNFSIWFEGSCTVDAAGQPLPLYHGSRVPYIEQFSLNKEGTGAVNTTSKKLGGIWFTSSRSNALYFADQREQVNANCDAIDVYGTAGEYFASITDLAGEQLFTVGPHPSRELAELAGRAAAVACQASPERAQCVTEVYLALRNPMILDQVIPRETEFQKARELGCDGIIARNVVDGAEPSDVFVAFYPEQIKATTNSGLFDWRSARIEDLVLIAQIPQTRAIQAIQTVKAASKLRGARKSKSQPLPPQSCP